MKNCPTEFVLTDEHVKLLRLAWVGWDDCETGAPNIDPKRPYGNSDVAYDVAEILGLYRACADNDGELPEELFDRMISIHRETEVALQIVLCTGSFEPGVYYRPEKYSTRLWVRK